MTTSVAGDFDDAEPVAICLQVTVWTQGRWRVRAEWGDGHKRWFDGPFELARFLASPPAPAIAGANGGLR